MCYAGGLPTLGQPVKGEAMDPEERAVLVEDVAGTPVAVGAIADGSQVIAHDGYDVQVWREALKSYKRLASLAHEEIGRAHV